MKKKKLLKELEKYIDSIDSDINTVYNFDMCCCDSREVETLECVFKALDRLLRKARGED